MTPRDRDASVSKLNQSLMGLDVPQLPSRQGSPGSCAHGGKASITSVLEKINKLPLEKIVDEISDVLQTANGTLKDATPSEAARREFQDHLGSSRFIGGRS